MGESGNNLEGTVSFLSVGTQVLLTDTMDQLIRTQGNYRTHYAGSMSSALRVFSEGMVHILVTEIDLGDGSAFRLLQNLGGSANPDDLYIVLATHENNEAVNSLATELEAHTILAKPFTAADLKALLEKYKVWRATPKQQWQSLVREAQFSARDKRYREAETNYLNAIKSAPGNPVPVYKAALYYMRKPDLPMAEKLLKRAVDIDANFVSAVSALGSLCLLKGDLEQAETFLKKAQVMSPLNPDRLVETTKLYLERCMETCKNSLRLDPGNIQARYMLGKLMAVQKDYIGAVRELESVLPKLKDETRAETQTFVALSRKLGSLAK